MRLAGYLYRQQPRNIWNEPVMRGLTDSIAASIECLDGAFTCGTEQNILGIRFFFFA